MRARFFQAFFVLFVQICVSSVQAQSIEDLNGEGVSLSPPQTAIAGKTAILSLESMPFDAQYTGVVIRGFASDNQTQGWIRFKENKSWGEWESLYIIFSSTDGTFMAGYRSDVLRRDVPFTVRFEMQDGAVFQVFEAGVFDSRQDEDRRTPLDSDDLLSHIQFSVSQIIIPPRLIRRNEWNAEPFRGSPSRLAQPDYLYITFHHTAGFRALSLDEGLVQVKSIQDFHQNGRGWSDIGYHFLVDQAGNLYQGRPFLSEAVSLDDVPTLVRGAHVGEANTGNIGLSVLGCFHPAEGAHCLDIINATTLNTIVTMFAFLCERYGVTPDNIMGHRDFSSTACPGDNNYTLLPEIRDRVRTLLISGNQPVGVGTIDAVSDADGVVHLSWEIVEDYGIETIRVERVFQNQVTELLQQTGTSTIALSDDGITSPGAVTYRLLATSELGYEQTLASIEIIVSPPDVSLLSNSFPNPTSNTATIRYFLKQDGFVKLNVYDLTGREVTTLTDGYQDGGHWYYQRLNTSTLPSGTYYYRILVEGFSGIIVDETRALVVVK